MSAFKLSDARQGLSTKGEGRSWGNQRNQGVSRYNAWVIFYNQDERNMEAMQFDDAPAVYWSKDVLLAFAKYLAFEAVKLKKNLTSSNAKYLDEDAENTISLESGTVIQYFSGFTRALSDKYDPNKSDSSSVENNQFLIDMIENSVQYQKFIIFRFPIEI